MARATAVHGVAIVCAASFACSLTGESTYYRSRPDVPRVDSHAVDAAMVADASDVSDASARDVVGIDAFDAAPEDVFVNIDVQRIADAAVPEPDGSNFADGFTSSDAVVTPGDAGGMERLWTTPPGWVTPPDVELTAVWAASTGEVWIGGLHGTMYFKSGTMWTAETLPTLGSILAPIRVSVQSLWGTDDDVWAACTLERGLLTHGVLLRRQRRAGAVWRIWGGGYGNELNGVYFGDATHGFIVGDDTYVFSVDADLPGVALGVLNTQRQPLLRVSGYLGEEVWAVGHAGNVVRFGHATDAQRMSPPGIGTGDTVTDVFVGSGTPRERAVVSSNGALDILVDSRWFVIPPEITTAARDGGAPHDAGVVLRDLRGVWIAPTGEVNAVGADGVAIRIDSSLSSYTIEPTATRARLNDVFGTTRNDVWAVGEHGTVLHRVSTGF